MPWAIAYLEDLDAVQTDYEGLIPPDDLVQAARETLLVADARRTDRLLGDCTKLEGGHTVVDLYGLARLVEEIFKGRAIHEALVMPELKAAAHEVSFWETTCRNRGLDVRVFRTREDAKAWLTRIRAPEPASA